MLKHFSPALLPPLKWVSCIRRVSTEVDDTSMTDTCKLSACRSCTCDTWLIGSSDRCFRLSSSTVSAARCAPDEWPINTIRPYHHTPTIHTFSISNKASHGWRQYNTRLQWYFIRRILCKCCKSVAHKGPHQRKLLKWWRLHCLFSHFKGFLHWCSVITNNYGLKCSTVELGACGRQTDRQTNG